MCLSFTLMSIEYYDVLSNIFFLQDECFCMKFGLEEELIIKTSITQFWMVCHLLPFAKVRQYSMISKNSVQIPLYIYDHNALNGNGDSIHECTSFYVHSEHCYTTSKMKMINLHFLLEYDRTPLHQWFRTSLLRDENEAITCKSGPNGYA